jgi:hypothetical protein
MFGINLEGNRVSDGRVIRSPLLPGGDLISAVLDREVMALADRGGASGMVGHRWADVCADWAERWCGSLSPVPGDSSLPLAVERVARLDARPEIARAASKRGMQNPDLLFLGVRDGSPAIQAADAKFSVETARSKQVSPGVVEALLSVDNLLSPLVGDLPGDLAIVPGVFLCPEFALTHTMLERGRGITRVTVSPDEVILVSVSATEFFLKMEGANIMPILAAVDALPIDHRQSLLAGLYYFRLARAAIGCWLDSVKPLLLYNDTVDVDVIAVAAEAVVRSEIANAAIELVLAWDAEVQTVRAERASVEQVAALPLLTRDLREIIAAESAALGAEAPSTNQVRRRVGAWYRGQLRELVGPMRPPIADFPKALQDLAKAGAKVTPKLKVETRRIVVELIEHRESMALEELVSEPAIS